MKIIDTSISDVKILEPQVFGDDRGYFMETFRDSWFREMISDVKFVQDNQSKSLKGTLRGLHYQLKQPQGKLVRVTQGEVFDVAVDLRESSPTFGEYVGVYLSANNARQFWVPEGFAHGFYVISESAEFVYKCTNYYDPSSEYCLKWNDSNVGIDWPLDGSSPILSPKDESGLDFSDTPKFK